METGGSVDLGPGALRLIAEELATVERRLAEVVASREPRLAGVARHLIDAGGKRVRPAVALLVYHACRGSPAMPRRDDAIKMAVALELIHSASLLHDDIIDGSATRRGRPSALSTYGLADTLVGGDFLFSRAFELCAGFEPEVIGWAAEACIRLTEGEVMQGRFRHNPAVTFADYLEIVERKTASLFAQGARTAAHLAGSPAQVCSTMAECGKLIGMAFQMADDLLDVTGEPRVTGKPARVDLRDGNPSLPLVIGIERDPEVARFFARTDPDDAAIREAVERLVRCGVLGEVRRLAEERANDAARLLAALPPSAYRDALLELTKGLVARER